MGKPGDFFVGIVDLFAIFLPGGLLTFVLYQQYSAFLLNVVPISGNQYWLAFVFFSYLIGHVIFMIGSKIDGLYDYHRKKRNPYINTSAFQCASQIKHKFLSETESKAVNTYMWSTSILTTQYSDAIVEINRLVADSKFFRSLVVIIPIISLVFVDGGNYQHALMTILFIVPCYLRYYDRRLKSTTRTYQYIIMLNGLGKLSAPNESKKMT